MPLGEEYSNSREVVKQGYFKAQYYSFNDHNWQAPR